MLGAATQMTPSQPYKRQNRGYGTRPLLPILTMLLNSTDPGYAMLRKAKSCPKTLSIGGIEVGVGR